MQRINTDAIILNNMDYMESDKIVCAITETRGLIHGIAKGAKRSKKRFTGTLEPFSEVSINLFTKPGLELYRIESATLKSPNLAIREDLDLLAHASFLLELIMNLMGQDDPNPEVYQYLKESLSLMEPKSNWFSVWSITMLGLLKSLGYGIDMDKWSKGNTSLKIGNMIYDTGPYHLPQESLAFLVKGGRMPLSLVKRMGTSMRARIEIEKFFTYLCQRITGKPLKSASFMAKLLDEKLTQ